MQEKIKLQVCEPLPHNTSSNYKCYMKVRNYREVPIESPEYPAEQLNNQTNELRNSMPMTPATRTHGLHAESSERSFGAEENSFNLEQLSKSIM